MQPEAAACDTLTCPWSHALPSPVCKLGPCMLTTTARIRTPIHTCRARSTSLLAMPRLEERAVVVGMPATNRHTNTSSSTSKQHQVNQHKAAAAITAGSTQAACTRGSGSKTHQCTQTHVHTHVNTNAFDCRQQLLQLKLHTPAMPATFCTAALLQNSSSVSALLSSTRERYCKFSALDMHAHPHT